MLKEFRAFALRGNVLDMGVGIVIGAAFGRIVTSFVSDILTPPLGFVLGGETFSNFFLVLAGGKYATLAEAKSAGAVTLNYGLFFGSVIDFAIVAFALFLLIRWVNRLKGPVPDPVKPASPEMRECPECMSAVPARARRCAHCTSSLE